MGNYIYNILPKHMNARTETPRTKEVLIGGAAVAHFPDRESAKIHFTRYAYKERRASWLGRDDYDPMRRHCGPNIRAWERRGECDPPMFVHCCENKTELAEASDLGRSHEEHATAEDVWPTLVPAPVWGMRYVVPVRQSAHSDPVYNDGCAMETVGFLVPRTRNSAIPTRRTQWDFFAAVPECV